MNPFCFQFFFFVHLSAVLHLHVFTITSEKQKMFFLLHAIFLFCFYELRYVKTQLQRRTPQSTGTFLKFSIYLRTYNIYVGINNYSGSYCRQRYTENAGFYQPNRRERSIKKSILHKNSEL